MRVMAKITIPVTNGNEAITTGRMGKIVQAAMENLKPEAAYFTALDGCRTAIFFLDMQDSSKMPPAVRAVFRWPQRRDPDHAGHERRGTREGLRSGRQHDQEDSADLTRKGPGATEGQRFSLPLTA